MKKIKYWNLAGCGSLTLHDETLHDETFLYNCGEGGGNILFETGEVYENGKYIGTADEFTLGEFTSDFDGTMEF